VNQKVKLSRILCGLFAGTVACGVASAGDLQVAPARHSGITVPYAEPNSPNAPTTIATNLYTDPANVYDALSGGYYVAGVSNTVTAEQWIAIPFVPKANSHAKSIKTAIGYISGTQRIKIGIYTDAGGTVGTPVTGGQGIITTFPVLGVCCTLTTTNLAGAGAALTGGTTYWLVARADDVNAPDAATAWQFSNQGRVAGNQPQPPPGTGWFTFSAQWPAYSITGTAP
jgi:hypothetical protein